MSHYGIRFADKTGEVRTNEEIEEMVEQMTEIAKIYGYDVESCGDWNGFHTIFQMESEGVKKIVEWTEKNMGYLSGDTIFAGRCKSCKAKVLLQESEWSCVNKKCPHHAGETSELFEGPEWVYAIR